MNVYPVLITGFQIFDASSDNREVHCACVTFVVCRNIKYVGRRVLYRRKFNANTDTDTDTTLKCRLRGADVCVGSTQLLCIICMYVHCRT
jgi:hypothetical protein